MARARRSTEVHDSALRPVWLVRAGRHGEDEEASLEGKLAIIGFRDVPSVAGLNDQNAIIDHVRKATPAAKDSNIWNRAAQINAFARRMEPGDIVAMPLKTQPGQIALGKVAGPYRFQDVAGSPRHSRAVHWVRPDTPRTAFEQDLLYSLGAFMTVCRIQRNDAERRFAAVIAGKEDPGPAEEVEAEVVQTATTEPPRESLPDVSRLAEDQIVHHIQKQFREHDLARLVEALLIAEGYHTYRSPPGADGGVDILAGSGPVGFEGHKLCVQVKSSRSPADVKIFRELKGTMDSFKADRGLLVSWGGFTKPLQLEARQSFFQVRLWDSLDLVGAIYRNYDRLPGEIQAELPLKRVWALVTEEPEE